MTAVPRPETTLDRVYAAWEQSQDGGLRPHLGCSEIGEECERKLFLGFRWCEPSQFSGRLLRKFDGGRKEEARIAQDLRMAGCEVWLDDGTDSYKVRWHGGHFAGSLDGVVRGLVEAPKANHVLECKRLNSSRWKKVVEKGVREAEPVYYAQVQVYMLGAGIDRAVFAPVGGDPDELHLERVELDRAAAKALVDKAQRIIFAAEPPPRISNEPSWFTCKWCKFHPQCHGTAAPHITCRSCLHATPTVEGGWFCERHQKGIGTETQRQACPDHRYIPALLAAFAEPTDANEALNEVTYRNKLTGATFTNGDPPNGISSREIRAVEDKKILGQERTDATLAVVREMGGTYVR